MVLVLDQHQKPLMPCTEKRTQQLLERKRAVIHTLAPFTIRLKDRTVTESRLQPLRIQFDPGSQTTGVAILLEGTRGPKVRVFGELVHSLGGR